jgi:acyl-CoA thioesterase I
MVAACAVHASSPASGQGLAQDRRPFKLVALGDSLTAGYGLPAEDAFPTVLQKALNADGRDVVVTNAGVSGDTATDGLARLDWSVGSDADGVLVELGANDMLRGIDPAVTEKALGDILDRLKQRHIPAMLAGMLASPTLGRPYVDAFQAIYPRLATSRGVPLYPFFLQGVAGDDALQQADRMHPNVRGVETVVAAILPSVERFIDSARSEKTAGGPAPRPRRTE